MDDQEIGSGWDEAYVAACCSSYVDEVDEALFCARVEEEAAADGWGGGSFLDMLGALKKNGTRCAGYRIRCHISAQKHKRRQQRYITHPSLFFRRHCELCYISSVGSVVAGLEFLLQRFDRRLHCFLFG